MLGSPLVLRADNQGRRYQAMRTALSERGVRLLEPSEDPVGLVVTATDGRVPGSGDVRVRAELDAVPVEWGEAHLGGAVVRTD
jgi:hypothetical protein